MARRSRLRRVIGWLLPLGLVAFLGVACFGGKSYEFSDVRIDATVLPDGSLDLVEQRTFDFDGDFSFAFFTIEWPPERIEDFRVTEGGRELPVTSESTPGSQTRFRWSFAAEDEERTFTISYRARCAVDVWADTAHLLWQFIGRGWDVPTRHASIRLHLPGAATNPKRIERPVEPCPATAPAANVKTRPLEPGETLAWGHGPLGGEVRIPDPQTVTFEISDLEPATFVEGSVLFPETAVPLAYQVPAPQRDAIAARERALAESANAERRGLLAEEARRAERQRIFWPVLGGVVLLFVALVVISRLRDRVPSVPRVLQEPPERIHPVDLAQMWGAANGKHAAREVYRAQMLHLASIGAIELQPIGTVTDPEDFRVSRRDGTGASDRDKEFIEFLFPTATDDDVALSSLKPTGERRTELREWWKEVDATRKTVSRKVLPSTRAESWITTLLGVGGMVGSIVGVGLVGSDAVLLFPVSLIGMIVAHVLIRPRLGVEYRERMARWRAFRRFLRGFSSLPEAPALAVVIWEHYLVYAVALGVAKEVEKQVKALVPAEHLPSPWHGAPAGVMGYAYASSFNSVPVHSAAAVSTSSSSSGIGGFSGGGGGGGGFSGGGGGGGGGTGGGAG